MAEERIGLGPDNWTEGGMVDDVDVDIVEAKFCLFDYQGQQPEGPALMLGCKIVGGEDKVIAQYWSAGKVENFVPTGDGMGLKAVGKQSGLNKGCNLVILLESMLKKGFPKEKIDDIAKVIVGSRLHLNKIAQKAIKDQTSGEERARSVLVVTAVHKWGWEAKGTAKTPATKAAAPAKAKPAAAAPVEEAAEAEEAGENPLSDKAAEGVIAVARSNGGTVKRADISTPLFKLMAKDADKSKIVKLAFEPSFLSGPAGSGKWVYDDEADEVTLLD